MKNIKNLTKSGDWQTPADKPSHKDLELSCLMRIADATETIAQNYNNLLAERDRYKKWFYEEQAAKGILIKKVSALKGVITRMKNKGAKSDAND